MKLAIFDIDETLVRLTPVHKKAFRKTMKEVFKVDAEMDEIDFSGKMIKSNLKELAKVKRVHDRVIRVKIKKAVEAYSKNFISAIPPDVPVLPGVFSLLEHLRESDYFLAVVTGDTLDIAKAILERSGLGKYFSVVVASDNFKTRQEMVKRAVQLAGLRVKCKFDEVYVIGDSMHDVESARGIAKSVAVGTGFHSKEQLVGCKPDYYFENLASEGVKKLFG